MSHSRHRDAAVDRWLRRTPASAADLTVTEACLDAEQMAAWADGGLGAEARASLEGHLAICARCQAVAGTLARTESIAAWATPERRSPWRWLSWAVPLSAAATIVMLIVLDRRTPSAIPQSLDEASQMADARPSEPPAISPAGRADLKDQAPVREKQAENEKAKPGRTTDALGAVASSTPPAAAPPASTAQPAPRTLEQRAAAAQARAEESDFRLARGDDSAALEIRSPDPAVRWRVTGTQVHRSIDAGSTWTAAPSPVPAGITAGAAPSAAVCWLVGRGGVVFLSIDGATWQRTTSPGTTDLSAVRATDARNATVTTSDGREFATTDGGRTWVRRDAQEIRTAPF